jgi:hypothetical protein
MAKKAPKPPAEKPAAFDQLVDGMAFIHQSGEHMGHTCCDCGSSHNIRMTIINDEEIEVQYFKNASLTRLARQTGVNGVLVTADFYKSLVDLSEILKGWPKATVIEKDAKQYKKLRKTVRRLAKKISEDQHEFETWFKAGDYLDEGHS